MRNFRKQLLQFLEQEDFDKNLSDIHKFPIPKTINALFAFLCSSNKAIKNKINSIIIHSFYPKF